MSSRTILFSFFALYLCFVPIHGQKNAKVVGDSIVADPFKKTEIQSSISKQSGVDKSKSKFVPDPNKAVWLSALFPGMGQIYNKKYWKLPLIYGGLAGLTYALSWNNQYLKDYTLAYNDIKDSDPNTNAFLNLLSPSRLKMYQQGLISQDQLTTSIKTNKDYFRRNRDLTIISMVGLYFVCMIDAYVDAQLFQFDISPDLSVKVEPTMIKQNQLYGQSQSLGLQCSINF